MELFFFKAFQSNKKTKSTAASTVLIKDPAPTHIAIRMSYNLLSKLNKTEIVKMLLVFKKKLLCL